MLPGTAHILHVSLVALSVGGDGRTAAQVVLAAVRPDDAGADTADRFDWQAAVAAADRLATYLDSPGDAELRAEGNTWIVCEHHEDWAVVSGSDAELVSAKYRAAVPAVCHAGSGGWCHRDVEGDSFGFAVVVPRVAFQGERDR